MQVANAMTRGVECIRPGDTIADAAKRMADLNVGSLPVCGDNDKLIGMITDRDITIRATAAGCHPDKTLVRDILTPEIFCCFEDQHVDEAAQIMQERQVRRLVVLNNDNRLVGILSLGDVAVKTHNDRLSGEALERVSEPAMPMR
jgi:CBS domain-containing protein